MNYVIEVEATDGADADHLCERIVEFLQITDKGDYSGRVVKVIKK